MRIWILIFVFFLTGCVGIGMYQNPELVGKGNSAVGVGVPYLLVTKESGYIFPLPEPYFRYGISRNQELTVRIPMVNFLGLKEGFFSLGGGYRLGMRNFILSGGLLFYGGSETGALLFEPGVFYRYRPYIGGFSLPGGNLFSSFMFPAAVRFYIARSFVWRKVKILPGVQFVYIPGSGLSLVMEVGFQHILVRGFR